jgi:N-carbamoylputrescine amidase
LCEPATSPVEKIKQAMIDKHVALIDQAAVKGAQVVCLQELFYGPYFCAEQQVKWYELTESIPGPTTNLMQDLAKKHNMVMVVPMYEEDLPGV